MHASAKVPTSVRFSYYHAKLTVWILRLLPYDRALPIGAVHFQETVPPWARKVRLLARGERQLHVRGTSPWSVEHAVSDGP